MIIDSSVDEVARLEAEPKGMRETDVRDFLSARLRDADRADEKSPTLFLVNIAKLGMAGKVRNGR